MKPIKILVKKKTLVPTNKQIVHMYRSDWKNSIKIEYVDSPRIFKAIDGTGAIENDAQFAKMILDNRGQGEYLVLAWRKGRSKFWRFMHIKCMEERFVRVPRPQTSEQKEIQESKADYQKVKRRISEAQSDEERREIQEESKDIIEDIEMLREIRDLDAKKGGCAPYLKSIMPLYKEHEYQNVESNEVVETSKPLRWI